MQICISFTDSNQISLLRHQISKVHYTQLSSVPFSYSKVGVMLPRFMVTLGTHRAAKILPGSLLNLVEGRLPGTCHLYVCYKKGIKKSGALTPLGTQM